MKRYLKAAAACITVVFVILPAPVLVAEQAKQAPPAPIPSQILAAKKVFVANAGGDERSYEDPPPQFSGGADRAYNEFYAAMKTWGRFELVTAPANADLLFEIRFSNIEVDNVRGASFDPQFRLLIRDPKTSGVLWGLTEHVEWAILQGNRDKNFSQALAGIVAEVRRVSTPSAAAADSPKKQ